MVSGDDAGDLSAGNLAGELLARNWRSWDDAQDLEAGEWG